MAYTSQVFQGGYYFLSGSPATAPTTVHAEVYDFFQGSLSGSFTITDTTDGATQINSGDAVTLNFGSGSGQAIYEGYYLDPNGMEYPLVYDPNPGEVAHGLYYSNYFLGIPVDSKDYQVIAAPYDQGTVCFAEGTLIRTPRGEVAVEHLAIGDLVVTASGAHRRIRWLSHRAVDCRTHPRPHEALPIRISADAFGENRPARDLLISPGHSICVDVLGEVLIPAHALVNGATLQRVEVDEITYWHVELDSHDILLAENLQAESYLDIGNRDFFKHADVVVLADNPKSSQRTYADFCRPFHDTGPLVEVMRAQLAKRAEASGWSLSRDLELHLVVDGRRFDPVVRDMAARFHLPANATDVWLVSQTARPCDTSGTGDRRDLGLDIAAMRIEDGFHVRDVAMDDPLLCIGFHDVESGCRRWTSGRAKLSAALWADCEEDFYLRIELAGLPVPRWVAPAVEPVSPPRSRLGVVA